MKELKFKAWIKRKKRVVDVIEIDFLNKKIAYEIGKMKLFADFEDVELMEYTGVKNESNIEIYEGSILRHQQKMGIVAYDNGSYMLDTEGRHFYLQTFQEKAEVLGNIYENPEILEKNKN